MRISELARQARVAPSAIRFYERAGILPASRRSASGYRDYGDDDLRRLRVLATLRSLGLDLREAGRLAGMCSEGRCTEVAAELLPQVDARRSEIASAHAELDHLAAELARLARTLAAGGPRAVEQFERWENAEAAQHQDRAEAGREEGVPLLHVAEPGETSHRS